MIHDYDTGGASWRCAVGFALHGGFSSSVGDRALGGLGWVTAEGRPGKGGAGGAFARATVFDLRSRDLPVLNVSIRGSGDSGERFGSPLLANAAYLC